MVSLNSNLPEAIFRLDPSGMALPELASLSSPVAGCSRDAALEDLSKKVRKPYTITKSRESWTEPEHDKFVEALQLFERDWKKIEAFIGSKTVIQIRSHAQKYFLKVQKSGTHEHLPPPRPKRKAVHPYPQKATKIEIPSAQTSTSVPDPRSLQKPGLTSVRVHPETAATASSWTGKPVQGEAAYAPQPIPNVQSSGSIESTPRTKPTVLPDFCQVYSFIGSVFDPNTSGHLQKLKTMDPIDIETVLLLMRNLSVNLASSDFEDHRRLLSSYEVDVSDPITEIHSQETA